MDIAVILFSLVFLIYVAYKGYSVIIFAPVAALMAVFLNSPDLVMPFFSGVFMERMVDFIKLYFAVFLLGAIFGKVIAMSGFAKSITSFTLKVFGKHNAILAIVTVCAVLTYGGVSLFVVAFAVYPFGAELFKAADIPKRILPATIALGAFTFTMDAFPGSPQIQNIIPTAFFQTDSWAAPWLGLSGGLFIFLLGMIYLGWRKNSATVNGEGYGEGHFNEPDEEIRESLPKPIVAILPLVVVAVLNKAFTEMVPKYYGTIYRFSDMGFNGLPEIEISKVTAIWAVQISLVFGILTVVAFAFSHVRKNFATELNLGVSGAMLATLNTASEYGFGAVIAALPGFHAVTDLISDTFNNLLVNEAVTVSVLSGITGSASGGMSIALATMNESYLQQASDLCIPAEVLHRVASMASGGMDTLPHNGAIITLLVVTGLTHKQSYGDILVMTVIKTSAVFFIIFLYNVFGMV
ncbi:GntP family permease [Cecembia rubra]|uniref:H+/gluconate symporter-like permease n=1 Tax=Cecembia rubra TaxID=1485585 RepID=A0A2P8E4B1_9BACT|nr:GntP family permease [Cecembia rubra]PSL04302.1 H+/gluconate symporter-like permease [Cecembia rubra]